MSKCCCCNDGPSLADDPILVFAIYAIAFIPLASIYALDFITDKWRTIRNTRRNGMVQLFVSLPSLACVMFYIVVQVKNRDYKEAAAAIAVAVFNSYHVLRTIWGLVLLYEFRNWNIYALRCLASLGYYVPRYDYSEDVNNMLSEMKSCRARWKQILVRVFESLKTRIMYVYNRLFSCTHPVSPLSDSVQPTSPSSAILDGTVDENCSRLSHQTNSSSISSSSTSYLLPQRVMRNCASFYNWAMGTMEEDYTVDDLSLEEIKRSVDYHMVVNSSLIDNEFTDAELPVRPTLFSRVVRSDPERHSAISRFVASCLKSTKPEECSVRWLVSFLARFGHEWLVDTKGLGMPSSESLRTSRRLGVLASAHTTQGSVKDNGSTEKFVTQFSPSHEYSTGFQEYIYGQTLITQRCMLPFKMNADFRNFLFFFNHEATIRDAAKDDWHKSSLNELRDEERSAVENITSVQLARFAALMENVELVKEDDTVLSESNTPMNWEEGGSIIDTLMYQLGYDAGTDPKEFFQALQVRKKTVSSFLWNNNPNCLLLQTSVHVDNHLALSCGDKLDAFVDEWQVSSQAGEPERTTSVFENQYNLEMRRLQYEVAGRAPFEGTCDNGRFIGCVAETVRSILASWVAENDSETAGWNVSIASVGIRFLCSRQLCSAISEMRTIDRDEKETQSLYMRVIWEIQSHLHWKVGDEVVRKCGDIRQSPFLIMLFVLGFPCLKVEASENEGTVSGSSSGDPTIEFEDGITVRPVSGPQELRILLTCDQESKTMSIIFSPESSVFNWQEWRDAFMGRLAAQKYWRTTRLSSNNELLRTETNHSDICSPVQDIALENVGKKYGLRYWSGWPPFSPQIAQFEIRNMVEYEFGVWDFDHFARRSSDFIGALNVVIDTHMQRRTDVGTLFADGCDAVEAGRPDDALRLFGRCIAEYGHREALKDAFGVITRKNTKSDFEVDILQKQMNIRFRTLLNRSHMEEENRVMDEIDLEMLANFFGRIYELTGSEEALKRKAVALFYESRANSAASKKAIHAIESFIIRMGDIFDDSSLVFYLAVAHQSRFHESQDQVQQEFAAKCMVRLKVWVHDDPDDRFGLSIGYLLEKGFLVGRDAKRINAMIERLCENEAYRSEKMLRTILGRLFVKQSASNESTNEVIGHERVFGIGIRPKDAMLVYHSEYTSLPKCTNRLGLLYHKGAQGIPADALAAEEKYATSIENGNHDALCNMGVLKCGTGEEDVGISYLKEAVDAGCSSGMNNLAVAYEVGNGVNRDILEAERLYKQCIEVDKNPVAMYNLAVLYMCGDPEVQNNENLFASLGMISELISPESELEPLYTLQEQVMKLDVLRGNRDETVSTRKVEVEELDECLVYVKILETGETSCVLGDEEGSEMGN